MTSGIRRREFIAGLGAGLGTGVLASPAIVRAEGQPVVIRAGALKLIHSIAPYFYEKFTPAGYKVEVIPFESPTEGKNAVVTKSVDFGMFGIAAATARRRSGRAGRGHRLACNRGHGDRSPGRTARSRRSRTSRASGSRSGPGSTQEVFILERLRMEGMTIKDIEPVRISFSEMHIALARGDIDAYVGAEPGPGVSLRSGIGKLVEYPYSTAMGSLNMVFGTHRDIDAASRTS